MGPKINANAYTNAVHVSTIYEQKKNKKRTCPSLPCLLV